MTTSKKKQTPRKKSSAQSLRPNLEAVAAITERASLADVVLLSSVAMNRGASRKNPPKVFEVSLNNHASHQRRQSEDGKSEITDRLVFDITVSIHAKDAVDAAEPKLSFVASYRITYGLAPGKKLSESQLAAFGTLQGAPIIWPYMSAFVHSSAMLMGLPGLRMPLFEKGAIQITRDK